MRPRDTSVPTLTDHRFIKLACASDPQASWHARVTLRLSYIFKGVTRSKNKFPGWEQNPNVREVPFAACGSPVELEELIRRAQLALVHPLEDASMFAQGRVSALDPEQTCRVNFSPNIVCIYLSAPTLPNLSFYDLPGTSPFTTFNAYCINTLQVSSASRITRTMSS